MINCMHTFQCVQYNTFAPYTSTITHQSGSISQELFFWPVAAPHSVRAFAWVGTPPDDSHQIPVSTMYT